MRISELWVGGFGGLKAGLGLKPGPGLNLVCAPNEGGKSTLAGFIETMLYGFSRRVGGVHPMQPWAASQNGGELGGSLEYTLDDGGAYKIERHLAASREVTRLYDGRGEAVKRGKAQPGQMHLKVSQGVYRTVSSIELDDLLHAFSGLKDKQSRQAREELLGFFFQEAATTGEINNPVQVAKKWQDLAKALYSRDRRSGREDRDMLKALEGAEAALTRAKADHEKAHMVRSELTALADRIQSLKLKRKQAAKEAELARLNLETARDLARARELETGIKALSQKGLCDQETWLKARGLEQKHKTLKEEARAAEKRNQETNIRLAELKPSGRAKDWDQELSVLNREAAELKAAEKHQKEQGQALESGSEALSHIWGLETAALAELSRDILEKLSALDAEKERLRTDLARLDEKAAGFPARPNGPARLLPGGWALIGLGLVSGLLRLTAISHDWLWLATAALTAGGALLVVMGLKGRQALRAFQELSARRQEIKAGAEAAAQKKDGLLEKAGLKGRDFKPQDLAMAGAEATRIQTDFRALHKQAQALTLKRVDLTEKIAALGGQGPGLDQALAQAEGRRREAARLEQEAAAFARQAGDKIDHANQAQTQLTELLKELNAADPAALKKAMERGLEKNRLAAQLDEVSERIRRRGLADPGRDDEALSQELAACGERVAALDKEMREAGHKRGALEQELRELGAGATPAQAEAELESLKQKRSRLAREHAVLTTANLVLSRAMDEFRLKAQPELLRRAGSYLSRATDGAYQWLGSDLFAQDRASEPPLTARSGPGARERDAGALSRGTRDQLYLCLRLALADSITDGKESIPLILDDPLVNFDPERLKSTLSMLHGLSESRQVLFLTCHPVQAEHLAGLPGTTLLTL